MVGLGVAFAITGGVAVVLIVCAVLVFCRWLVQHTDSADSLKFVPPILRAMRDMLRLRQRPLSRVVGCAAHLVGRQVQLESSEVDPQ